jgi:hypothetical protein
MSDYLSWPDLESRPPDGGWWTPTHVSVLDGSGIRVPYETAEYMLCENENGDAWVEYDKTLWEAADE